MSYFNWLLTQTGLQHMWGTQQGVTALFTPVLCERVVLFWVTVPVLKSLSPLFRFQKQPEQKAFWPIAPIQFATNYHWPCKTQVSFANVCALPLSMHSSLLPLSLQQLYIRWISTWRGWVLMPNGSSPVEKKKTCSLIVSSLAWNIYQCLGHAAAWPQEHTKGKHKCSAEKL